MLTLLVEYEMLSFKKEKPDVYSLAGIVGLSESIGPFCVRPAICASNIPQGAYRVKTNHKKFPAKVHKEDAPI